MKYLDMLLVCSALAIAATAARADQTVYLGYADGHIEEVSVAESRRSDLEAPTDIGDAVLTFDTSVIVRSENLRELAAVHAGQRVAIGIEFNALQTLEVPFEELIGRELLLRVVAPRIGFEYDIPFSIGPDNGALTGISAIFTVPDTAQAGAFGIAGRCGIEGYTAVDASARGARFVRE